MQARAVLVAVLLLAIGASGCLGSDDDFGNNFDDDSTSTVQRIEIFDDRIEVYGGFGGTYNASGPRDAGHAKADPDWTMQVTNRGDREHAVTVVDRDNDTRRVYDHVLQPSQDVRFNFPYVGNFTLYDRLTSTPDSGLFVKYRVSEFGIAA